MPFGYSYQLFGSDVPFALQRYGALVCEFVGGTTLWGLTSRTLSPFLRVFSQAQAIIRVTTALDLLTHSHDGDLFTLSCFNNFSLIQDNINRAVISSWLTVDLEGEKKKALLTPHFEDCLQRDGTAKTPYQDHLDFISGLVWLPL